MQPSELPSPRRIASVQAALVAWYRRHRRDLPWRQSHDPYAVWVSEMMLQQTQVATVIPYYERWMQRFPSVAALAAATEPEVLHAWQGLGYYSRARSLRNGARAVVERFGGQLPRSAAALRSLPGIGPYSAGAIASIAYDLPEPIVDGNVLRVLCRLQCLRGDPRRAPLQQLLWALARAYVPAKGARDFNQGLMELGATVCTPKAPDCARCPLRRACRARQAGLTGELPELPKRAPATAVEMAAAVVARGQRVLLVRLADDAPRWSGMWLFPAAELGTSEPPAAGAERAVREAVGLGVRDLRPLTVVRHTVTRFRIRLHVFRAGAAAGRARASGLADLRWVPLETIGELALPSAHQRIAALLTGAPRARPARGSVRRATAAEPPPRA